MSEQNTSQGKTTRLAISTVPDVQALKIEWAIENYVLCERTGYEHIESFPITVGEVKGALQWWYPSRQNEHYGLFFVQKNEVSWKGMLTFSFLPSKNTICNKGQMVVEKDDRHKVKFGYNNFINKDDFIELNLLHDGSLRIFCKIEVVSGYQSISKHKPESIELDNTLSEDLSNSLNLSDLSDITLSVKGKEFKLHKVILAARSPVFAAMFKHPLEENNSNVITIEDVSADIVEEVVRYLYTGKAPEDLKETLLDVLSFADRYDLRGLKEVCAEEVLSDLSVESSFDALVLADRYNVSSLKPRVIEYMSRHSGEVLADPGWEGLATEHRHLLAELNNAFVQYHLVKKPT